MDEYLEHKGMTMHYRVLGSGARGWLCFHGFGRRAEDFEVFRPLMGEDDRLVCITLFGHGQSLFPRERMEQRPLQQEEWCEIVGLLLEAEGFERFNLLGYSMGGRVAMMTYLGFAGRVDRMLLLAPDGLKKNILYQFASDTFLGRAIYRSVIPDPSILFTLSKLLNRLGLLSDKLHRFVHVHLDTREKRELVYSVWLIYRRLFPDCAELAQRLNSCGTQCDMIFGSYDSIIPVRLANRLVKRLRQPDIIHKVAVGHRLMERTTLDYIRDRGLWK
jgi:pimeloyl-ACP methyl ester carboxylesterase